MWLPLLGVVVMSGLIWLGARIFLRVTHLAHPDDVADIALIGFICGLGTGLLTWVVLYMR